MTDPRPDSSTPSPVQRRPIAVPLVGVALGVAMFLVSWLVADAPGQGVAMLAIMLAYATVMRHGQRFETVQVLSQDPPLDERHALIQQRAVAIAYYAVVGVSLIGFIWEMAHGTTGAFTLICFVGGITHMCATAILRRRL